MSDVTGSANNRSVTTVGAKDDGRGAPAPRPSPRLSFTAGLVLKLFVLFVINAVVISGMFRMLDKGQVGWVFFSIAALVLLDWIYLSSRRVPGKYLFPGTILLVVFALYPVLYTVFISFTNYGTGNNVNKAQAIRTIEVNSVEQREDAPRYQLQILGKGSPTGEIAFLLQDEQGAYFLGTATELTPLTPDQIIEQGTRKTIDGYVALNSGQSQARVTEIQEFRVPSPGGQIQNEGFSSAYAKVQRLQYDKGTNTMVDVIDGTVFKVVNGAFVSDAGRRLDPGWRTLVGTANYREIVSPDSSQMSRSDFVRVVTWTFVFSLGTVLLTFWLGLQLALVFDNPRMRGRAIYRSLIIIPYALPSFMTALVWRGMFNQQFGVINRWLGIDWAWLDGRWLPFVSILIVNLWLGYPYMFLVCTGALQGIPADLKEAAYVDGATGFKAFKAVTFPLLLIAVAPLLVASFAFNFNNFNLIYLLTEGKPPVPGSDVGRTDILISATYKIAFGGGRGADYGLASAIAVVIFVIVATISAFSFRFTKVFEEVR